MSTRTDDAVDTRPTGRPGRARPGRAVLAAETRLFLREPGSLFWVLVFPSVLVVILGLVPGFQDPDEQFGGVSAVGAYVTVACLLAAIMSGALAMPGVVTGYRERQVLRRIATTPARAGHVLAAQIALHGTAVLVSVVLVLAVGRFGYGVPLPGNPLGWVLAYLLALLSMLAVGAVVSGVAPTARVATTLATVVFFPLMFTAGVWFPVAAMSGWLLDVVSVTPMGAAALALGEAQAGGWPAPVHLAVVAGWAVVLGLVATRWFRWQ